jgi:hypothetical protein
MFDVFVALVFLAMVIAPSLVAMRLVYHSDREDSGQV